MFSLLLNLPPELRHTIYTYISPPFIHPRASLGLVLSCKQLRDEYACEVHRALVAFLHGFEVQTRSVRVTILGGNGRPRVRLDLSTSVFNDYTRENGCDGEALKEVMDMYFDEVVLGWYDDGGVEFGADNVRWVRKWTNKYGLGRGKVRSVVLEVPASMEEKWRGWMELAVYGRSGRKGERGSGERVVVVKNARGMGVDWRKIRGSWEVWEVWM